MKGCVVRRVHKKDKPSFNTKKIFIISEGNYIFSTIF